MNIRKLTRNPGWKRLFRVFAGIWYAVIVFLFVQGFIQQEQAMDEEFTQQQSVVIPLTPERQAKKVTDPNLLAQLNSSDSQLTKVSDPELLAQLEGTEQQAKTVTDPDLIAKLEARLAELIKQKKSEQRTNFALLFLPFAFVPLIILFFMRLFRYVIEGFAGGNE